ncbi:radical SAM protein [Sorangium sp. So ce1335]|uniref:radical SAM protein n=1 Tax=Sorangium sp. So ce1335 TaxID=3133335 RepID=UPI003F64396D
MAVTTTSLAPLDWIVFKIAQRCNLNCTYCYVYNRGDDSWKGRPPIVPDEVVSAVGRRIAEQCAKYSLERFVVEMHGGEPLLVGKARMQRIIDSLRGLCPGVELRLILQTNGLLLDEEWLVLFERNGMSFGISLDGPPEVADRHRVFLNGKGSTRQLLQNIERLRRAGPRFDRLLGGVLCVVDPTVNGGDVVRWFVENGFDCFEFLLPDVNYVNQSPGWPGVAPFRRFLQEAFDAWYALEERAPQIRLFEVMLMAFMGIKPQLDALGGDLRKLCVVESDGSIGVSDVLRFCQGEFSVDRLNVATDPLDARTDAYRIDEIQRPSAKCEACPHLQSCGGGYLPHRYDGRSFANPSIYCEALYAVAERMAAALRADVPPSLIQIRPTAAGSTAGRLEVSP